LSKTKSSEPASNGSVVSTSREKARYPVWNSDNFVPSMTFWNAVRARFDTYLYRGIPPARAVPPRMRDPRTTS
jgi:hypothetical protein